MELKKYLFTAASVVALSTSMAIAGPGDSSSSLDSKGSSSPTTIVTTACSPEASAGAAESRDSSEASRSRGSSFFSKLKSAKRKAEAKLEKGIGAVGSALGNDSLVDGDGTLSAGEIMGAIGFGLRTTAKATESAVQVLTLADEALGVVGAGDALDGLRETAERVDDAVDDVCDKAAPALTIGGAVADVVDGEAGMDEIAAAIAQAKQEG